MRGVVLATDRRVVNSSELHRFSDNEERWWFRFAYDGEIVQVCLAGSSECPDAFSGGRTFRNGYKDGQTAWNR